MSNHQQIFSAESRALRPRQVFASMFRGLQQSPYIAYRLVLKDIRAEYSKSFLGIFWDFLDPLIMCLVFYALRRSNILATGEFTMPYLIFLIYGLLMYITFTESLMLSLGMMQRSKGLLTHLKFPPEAMLLSVFLRAVFNSSFRIVVMLLFSLFLAGQAKEAGLSAFSLIGFLKFIVLYASLILAGMSIGILLAPFEVIYKDVGRLVRVVILPLRFVSPVLWSIPNVGVFLWINRLNPISPLLNDLRLLATSNHMEQSLEFTMRCGIFGVLFLLAWYVFHLSVPVMAERM